jgi:hypothetical protein
MQDQVFPGFLSRGFGEICLAIQVAVGAEVVSGARVVDGDADGPLARAELAASTNRLSSNCRCGWNGPDRQCATTQYGHCKGRLMEIFRTWRSPRGAGRIMSVACAVLICGSCVLPPAVARGDMNLGNYNLNIPDRYDFHTWIWAITNCSGTCVRVSTPSRNPSRGHSITARTGSRPTAITHWPSMSPTDYVAATSIMGQSLQRTTYIPGMQPHWRVP